MNAPDPTGATVDGPDDLDDKAATVAEKALDQLAAQVATLAAERDAAEVERDENRDRAELEQQRADRAVRERDSLARRCAVRFEETEKLRAELAERTRERDADGEEIVRLVRARDQARDLLAKLGKDYDRITAEADEVRDAAGRNTAAAVVWEVRAEAFKRERDALRLTVASLEGQLLDVQRDCIEAVKEQRRMSEVVGVAQAMHESFYRAKKRLKETGEYPEPGEWTALRKALLGAVERYQHPAVTPWTHTYDSTSCQHARHDPDLTDDQRAALHQRCSTAAPTFDGFKHPARCKHCRQGAGQCVCECHTTPDPARLVVDTRAAHPHATLGDIAAAHKVETHELTIIARPKMDSASLVAARCSCGYESSPGTEASVTKDWRHHAGAKGAVATGGVVGPWTYTTAPTMPAGEAMLVDWQGVRQAMAEGRDPSRHAVKLVLGDTAPDAPASSPSTSGPAPQPDPAWMPGEPVYAPEARWWRCTTCGAGVLNSGGGIPKACDYNGCAGTNEPIPGWEPIVARGTGQTQPGVSPADAVAMKDLTDEERRRWVEAMEETDGLPDGEGPLPGQGGGAAGPAENSEQAAAEGRDPGVPVPGVQGLAPDVDDPLSEAIEAAAQALFNGGNEAKRDWWSEGDLTAEARRSWRRAGYRTVRAAAPLIEREARRAAARDIGAEMETKAHDSDWDRGFYAGMARTLVVLHTLPHSSSLITDPAGSQDKTGEGDRG